MILESCPADLEAKFQRLFGSGSLVHSQAPGRVDLMGSHTDYNLGFVLTLPINHYTRIVARTRQDRCVTIHSLAMQDTSSFSLDDIQHDQIHPWANYVRGVAHILQSVGYVLTGFDGLIDSTIPIGSGLSSSAALEVAVGRLFQILNGLKIDPVHLALLCQEAENEFVGMHCGILDQFTSSVGEAGNALLLDCRTLTSQQVTISKEISIAICDTQAKRQLTGSEYSERRAQCEQGAAFFGSHYPGVSTLRDVNLDMMLAHVSELPVTIANRCRFIIEENQRVTQLSLSIHTGDQASIADLCSASFEGARDLYEIISPEMEAMHFAMISASGVIGARQAGAGFGGCMVAFIEKQAFKAFSDHASHAYFFQTGIEPRIFSAIGETYE